MRTTPTRMLRTALARVVTGVIAGAVLATTAGAQPSATTLDPAVRDGLRTTIRRLLDSARVASIAVAVARDGVILWEEGFGYADRARHVPATPATLYSIASISKPMTATAVMRLVQEGRVDLDRPIDDYLGAARVTGLAGDRAGATVRRVLSHTAGLPLHYRFYYADDPTRPNAAPNVAETIARYGRTMFPPGQVYSYSNLGFGMLGELVRHVGGTTYEAYMRDQVFRPLGMATTTIGTGAGLANAAVRYDARQRPIPYYDFDHRGASAVYTSAHELARFGMFHLKTRPRAAAGTTGTTGAAARWAPPLADASIDRMQQVTTPGDTAAGYGLGWAIARDPAGTPAASGSVRRISHTGGMPGVATVLNLYPAHGVAVVVLANQSTGLTGRIATEIAAAVLPPSYATAVAARRAAPPVAPVAFAAPAALRGEWRGTVRTYEGTLPLVLRIDSTEVRVRLGDAPGLWTLLNDATWRNDLLGGRFVGTMPTADARRVSHVVAMTLALRDGTMRGWVAAQATAETNDYSLSSYAELTRTSATAARSAP